MYGTCLPKCALKHQPASTTHSISTHGRACFASLPAHLCHTQKSRAQPASHTQELHATCESHPRAARHLHTAQEQHTTCVSLLRSARPAQTQAAVVHPQEKKEVKLRQVSVSVWLICWAPLMLASDPDLLPEVLLMWLRLGGFIQCLHQAAHII